MPFDRNPARLAGCPLAQNGDDQVITCVDQPLETHRPFREVLREIPPELKESVAAPIYRNFTEGLGGQHPLVIVCDDFQIEPGAGIASLNSRLDLFDKPPHNLDVLLRNNRSPCPLRHGFQRNALPEALELADQVPC
jgi:hypothetical protein